MMGNDFLPQQFCMNAKAGNFDAVLSQLKSFYKKKQIYLTNKFEVIWPHFLQFWD